MVSIYAETGNASQNITLNENTSIHSSTNIKTPPPNIGLFLLASCIGIIIGFIYAPNKNFKKLRSAYLKKNEEVEWKTVPYDEVVFDALEARAGKLNKIFPIIITIYAILLAFVVSDKAVLAYSNWYFVIWCGWVLAIIVRTGTVMIMLFEISKTERIEKIKRNILASSEFFKHSLYLLVPTVAFLPAFFIAPLPAPEMIKEPWEPGISIFSAGIAIIFLFFIFYRISLSVQEYAKEGGAQKTYFIVFLLIGLGAVAAYYPESSPINPMAVTVNSTEVYTIPTIFYVISIAGSAYFLWMLGVYYSVISTWLGRKWRKVKRNRE